MLAGVLEYKSIEGYPRAVRALNEATRLGALGGVRVRGRMVPCRFFAYKQVTVRTRGKERVTGRVVQVEADGVSKDNIRRKPPRERRNGAGQAQAHAEMEFKRIGRQAKRSTRRDSSQRRRRILLSELPDVRHCARMRRRATTGWLRSDSTNLYFS